MVEKVYKETREKMDKAIEALKKEQSRIRTGRASVSILDGLRVQYYGSLVPLNQVASVAVPESRLITIQPWDIKAIGDIEKAHQYPPLDRGKTPGFGQGDQENGRRIQSGLEESPPGIQRIFQRTEKR
jgi:hypothetical protein